VMLLFISIRQIFGPAPAWFHLFVIAVHMAATGLTFVMLRRLTGNAMLAMLAAAIFGLHPSRVESVSWISGVSDSLCFVFFLGSAILFFRWETEGSKRDWIVSGLLLFLGILSKEVVILAPIAFALHRWMTLDGRMSARVRTAVVSVMPHAIAIAAALGLRMYALKNFTGPAAAYKTYPLATLFTAPEVMLWYMRQQVWPAVVSVHYPMLLERQFSWLHFVLPFLAVTLVLGAIAYLVRRSPSGMFLFVWAMLTIAPVIVYHITIQAHDRYAYLPAISAAAGIAYLILKACGQRRKIRNAVIATLLVAMTGWTFVQSRYWKNDTVLFEHAVSVAYDHGHAYGALVAAYGMEDRIDKAYETAVKWSQTRDKVGAYMTLSMMALEKNDIAGAREAYEKAAPELSEVRRYFLLGNIEVADGRCVEAEAAFRKAIEANPHVSVIRSKLAAALTCQHRANEALAELQKAREIRDADLY
jgi:protein O-mannosyl-transferase